MEGLSALVSALASLAWPAMVLFVLIRFYEPIKKLIESTNRRKFSIKVAGNELSFEEASEQQSAILQDIQEKVAALEARVVVNPDTARGFESNEAPTHQRILWVDDNPRNNSYLVAAIEDQGHIVDTALSTDEGFRKFSEKRYDSVVSGMGRPEGERAGIDLAKKIRRLDQETPIYIFCGKRAADNLKEHAQSEGVNGLTSSGITLLNYLLRNF